MLLLGAILALSLPPHTHIAAQEQRVPMRVSADGIVAANVTLIGASGTSRIVVWDHALHATLLSPPSALQPGELSAGLALGGFGGPSTLYVTRVASMELEAGGNHLTPVAYLGTLSAPLVLAPCAKITQPDFLPYVDDVTANGIYITYESPDSPEVLDGATTSALAPYAVLFDQGSCTLLGRASIRGASDGYVVGFRGYLGAFIAPTDLNIETQRYVAVRIHGGTLSELGPGVAMAVSPDGTAVGADELPGLHDASAPHAMLWRPDGTHVALAPHARSSVAYAIDEDDTVIGTLAGTDGKPYAFIWADGRLHLLDDVVPARGWHFEAAFAFGPREEILGTGTRHGVQSAFEIAE